MTDVIDAIVAKTGTGYHRIQKGNATCFANLDIILEKNQIKLLKGELKVEADLLEFEAEA